MLIMATDIDEAKVTDYPDDDPKDMKEDANKYPGVNYPIEHDVMLQRQVDDETRRSIIELDRNRLEHDEINSLRQMRAVALQVAKESTVYTGVNDLTTLLANAATVQDFMLNGTVPEGQPVTPEA